MKNPFRSFRASPVAIRFPLALCKVENLLHERDIDLSHETVLFWWNWFGRLFASEIRKESHSSVHNPSNLERHLSERNGFKENRQVALAKLRQLAA
jgi:putative transposase